ncbi:MAG: response regulator [Verrucomicrobiota bacterium]
MSRIVIAEDHEPLCALLCNTLQRAGHEVFQAFNGEECLHAVRTFAPDLVVTDINMPEKNGLEILMELKRTFPEIPVIAISGGAKLRIGNFLPIAKKLGAVRTLAKPFLLTQLHDAINESLEEFKTARILSRK